MPQNASELVELYVDLGRDGMIASGYGRGCGIAPLVIEGAVQTSDEVEEASRHGFTQVLDRLAFHFVSFGVERADARSLADAVVAGVQGAMITSRALRSPDPYDAVRTMLTGYAAGVSPKTAGRRHS